MPAVTRASSRRAGEGWIRQPMTGIETFAVSEPLPYLAAVLLAAPERAAGRPAVLACRAGRYAGKVGYVSR